MTFATPRVKNILDNFYKNDPSDIDPQELIFSTMNFLSNPSYKMILNEDNNVFGSSLEYKFWKKFNENFNDIRGTTLIPQMNLNSISSNKNSSDERVVDFYLWNSLNDDNPKIIEIDGSQHDKQKTVDSNRDNIAKFSGINTIRLKSKDLDQTDINLKETLNISKNINYVENLETYKDIDNNQNVSDLIRLSKFIYQIQITVLNSFLNKKINFDNHEYKISIFIPELIESIENIQIENLINSALSDIQDLLSNLTTIYDFKLEIPTLKYVKYNSVETKNVDINIVNTSNNNNNLNDYVITDISVPLQIGYIQQYPLELKVKKPDKKTCLWFLDYLFNHKKFEAGQWESIAQIFKGKDTISILRTGAGKSLIFQFVGILNSGISIIISPLVSLIHDQIFNLKSDGFDKTISFSSDINVSKDELAINISGGLFKFIYVTPERFQIDGFRQIIKSTLIKYHFSIAAIDEAHCISEWGHTFRTSYMRLAHTIRKLCKTKKKSPVITALTATAGDHVLNDMKRELDISIVLKYGNMARPEINYKIINCHSKDKPKNLSYISQTLLPEFFKMKPEEIYKKNDEKSICGIIYVPHKDNIYGVVEISQMWGNYTYTEPTIFSGDPPPKAYVLEGNKRWDEEKKENSLKFRRNEATTMIATNSFGMGINKQNVRYIINYIMPRSMESFYQESGRAGRSKDIQLNNSLNTIIFSDDYPDDNEIILDPSTPLEKSLELLNKPNRDSLEKDDDIGKTMWFHTNSFKGSEIDQTNMNNYLDEILKLSKDNNSVFVDLSWDKKVITNKNGDRCEVKGDFNKEIGLSIYRLNILGIIQDYTVDYSNKIFNLQLSDQKDDHIIQKLRQYIYNFDAGEDMIEVDRLASEFKENKDYKKLITSSIKILIDFLYKQVELSRRQSTNQTRSLFLQALEQPPDKQSEFIQRTLEAYFNSVDIHTKNFIDEIIDYDNFAINNLYEFIVKTKNADAANIGGSIDSSLSDHPTNPWLYLLRFGIEIKSADMYMTRVSQNIAASIIYLKNDEDKNKGINYIINLINNAIKEDTLSFDDANLIMKNLVENSNLINKDKIYMLKLINELNLISDDLKIIASTLLTESILNQYKKLQIN